MTVTVDKSDYIFKYPPICPDFSQYPAVFVCDTAVIYSRCGKVLYCVFQKRTSGQYIPPCFGLLLLPLFEESGHHHFGPVTLVERPKIFGLQRHFVAFNGHPEIEKQHVNSIFYTRQAETLRKDNMYIYVLCKTKSHYYSGTLGSTNMVLYCHQKTPMSFMLQDLKLL